MSELRPLRIEPLTSEAFAPFGDVIEPAGAQRTFAINNGTTQRFHDVASIQLDEHGRALLSLCRAQPRALPFVVEMLERHPLGSQAFMPLDPATRYLVVVAEAPDAPPRAFLASHGQGVNYHRGIWHHPLLALDRDSDFAIVDRGGAGSNCDEAALPQQWVIESL